MIESFLRPDFQKTCVDPVVTMIERTTRLTPMGLTYLAGIAGILSAVLLWRGYSGLACLLLIVSGYLDVLDGSLARKQNQSTSKGAVLDIVVDRVVEFAILFALYSVSPVARATPVLWMLGSTLICVTSFLVVGVFTDNQSEKSFHYSAGLIERAEAFLFFILMIVRPDWFIVLAWLYTTLVLVTAGIRVRQYLKT